MMENPDEEWSFIPYYFDFLLKLKVRNNIQKLNQYNREIQFSLSGAEEENISFDPEVQKKLKAIGYLR